MSIKLTTKEFIERANIIHNQKYDYSKINYIRGKDKVEIICPKHDLFFQIAENHLQGFGCKYCSATGDRLAFNNVISKLKNKFPKLDFSQTYYKLSSDNFTVICSEHGQFTTSKKKLLKFINYNGCPGCKKKFYNSTNLYTRTGWRNKYLGKDTFVYLLAIKTPSEECLKIGMTGNLKQRLRSIELQNVSVKLLDYMKFSNPEESYDMEKLLFKMLKKYKIVTNYNFGGKTECFVNNTEVLYNFQLMGQKV